MKKIRVWLYCRVAHRDQNDLAMQWQEEVLRQKADTEKYEIVGVTREYGPGKGTNRPHLRKVENEAQKDGMDQLWVISADRISRDTYSLLKWVEQMTECGVTICIPEGKGRFSNLISQSDPLESMQHSILTE